MKEQKEKCSEHSVLRKQKTDKRANGTSEDTVWVCKAGSVDEGRSHRGARLHRARHGDQAEVNIIRHHHDHQPGSSTGPPAVGVPQHRRPRGRGKAHREPVGTKAGSMCPRETLVPMDCVTKISDSLCASWVGLSRNKERTGATRHQA